MHALLKLGGKFYQSAVLILGFAYFGIVGLLYTLVSTPIQPFLPRKAGAWFGRNSIGWFFRSYLAILQASGILRLELEALDALRNERGLIVAPNHPCLLDAVLVISRLPDITCIMKAEIWDSLVLGGGARLAGYIRNDSASKMIRHATEELHAGCQLLVFPEGTRTRRKPVSAFKGGFALIAKKSGVPIQTVFIETNSAFLGKGWPILKRPPMPLTYQARLDRIAWSKSGGMRTVADDSRCNLFSSHGRAVRRGVCHCLAVAISFSFVAFGSICGASS